MGHHGGQLTGEEIASALGWWADAGVDALIDEQPRNWLARAPTATAPSASVLPAAAALPDTLDAFIAWRMAGDDVPEAAWGVPRVAPAGRHDAPLMVLVDCPSDAALLAEAEQRLFARMLAAIGSAPDDVHLAATMWAEPAVKPEPAVRGRLEHLARHHVKLARPRATLALGDAASRALLAMNMAEARGRLHRVNHDGADMLVVASYHPRFLLQRPAAKAGSWADLQMILGELQS